LSCEEHSFIFYVYYTNSIDQHIKLISRTVVYVPFNALLGYMGTSASEGMK